jgi:hypothetical protein
MNPHFQGISPVTSAATSTPLSNQLSVRFRKNWFLVVPSSQDQDDRPSGKHAILTPALRKQLQPLSTIPLPGKRMHLVRFPMRHPSFYRKKNVTTQGSDR